MHQKLMDPESKELLEQTLKLEEENNEILRALRRSMRTARIMSLIYWVFIIGSAIGAYYFIQPYVDQLTNFYGGASDVLKSFSQ